MPDVETMRKRREAEAQRRDEVTRAERKIVADRERDRERKEVEKRRWEEAAHSKMIAAKAIETAAAEKKSLQSRAEMGDKKAQRLLDEMAKTGGGPRPYTGQVDDE
jgi:hypothetical protein